MVALVTRLRAVGLFYRGVAPFTVGVSALILLVVLWPALHEGWASGLVLKLLLVKLATGPAAWYLSEQLRPNQYWFYFNLGASRRFLWVGLVAVDGLLFLGAAGALVAAFA
ncbi:MAG: hypothetical protein ACRYFR_11030 [Janthinobacterium lividum]